MAKVGLWRLHRAISNRMLADMAEDPTARLNAALEGRYKIERMLGEGGMATVYLAEDLKHDRKVALKVLKPELGAIVGAERFLSEIKVTANPPASSHLAAARFRRSGQAPVLRDAARRGRVATRAFGARGDLVTQLQALANGGDLSHVLSALIEAGGAEQLRVPADG